MEEHVAKKGDNSLWLVCLLLVAGTLILFWPVGKFDFVGYDDPFYVTANPHVQAGFTKEGIAWAFGNIAGEATYWHPLTWMSHMLDCQLFGRKAGTHHRMNVLYHLTNVLLLFFLLRRLTGFLWGSAIVAAIFAWHPIQVESVAWVTERKNLLSTFFLLLTIWAYSRYVERLGSAESRESKVEGAEESVEKSSYFSAFAARLSTLDYWWVFIFFALGLMSKPMLVTLPCILLLLDFWPLQRFDLASQTGRMIKNLTALVIEKIPLFILAAISSAITILSHQHIAGLASSAQIPLSIRVANAFYSYSRYLKKLIWPSDLAAVYPFPTEWPVSRFVICILLLLCISVFALRQARRRPYILFGWLWFLGTLVPVIGLVQAGAQAMADRFVYVPLIGLLIGAVWGISDLLNNSHFLRRILAATTIALTATLLVVSRYQLQFWENSIRLFDRALQIEPQNPTAHYNYGYALAMQGKMAEAKKHYQQAITITSDYVDARNNLAAALLNEGKLAEASEQYQQVLRAHPDHPLANYNLGIVFQQQEKLDEAVKYFSAALKTQPANVDARLNLANCLGKMGKTEEALKEMATAVSLNPNSPEANYNAGNAMMMQQKTDEAFGFYAKALKLKPNYPEAHYNFGTALAMSGKIVEATSHFSEAVRLKPDFEEAQMAYARALAETGKVDEAIKTYREALRRTPDSPQALVSLAWILATHRDAKFRNGEEALKFAQRVMELTGGQKAEALDLLAATYAETGKFSDAVKAARQGLGIARSAWNKPLVEQLEQRIKLYEDGRPLRL